ncbi:hypothetical protein [Zavarzinella formosa]|uniref:hypothetical protein n=1 Tax=Zavarzinella formosa TaxID=360055 RepID=UPI0002DBD2A9|nr:hypothetical protein [Zavarzinella formosa]
MLAINFKAAWVVWLTVIAAGNIGLLAWPLPEPKPVALKPTLPSPPPISLVSNIPNTEKDPKLVVPKKEEPKKEEPKKEEPTSPQPVQIIPIPEPKGYQLKTGTETGTVLILVIAQDYSSDSARAGEMKTQLLKLETRFGKKLLGGTVFVLDHNGVRERETWAATPEYRSAFGREEFQPALRDVKKQLAHLTKQALPNGNRERIFPLIVWDSSYNPDDGDDQSSPSVAWDRNQDGPVPGFFWLRKANSKRLTAIFGNRLSTPPTNALDVLAGTVGDNFDFWNESTKGP